MKHLGFWIALAGFIIGFISGTQARASIQPNSESNVILACDVIENTQNPDAKELTLFVIKDGLKNLSGIITYKQKRIQLVRVIQQMASYKDAEKNNVMVMRGYGIKLKHIINDSKKFQGSLQLLGMSKIYSGMTSDTAAVPVLCEKID